MMLWSLIHFIDSSKIFNKKSFRGFYKKKSFKTSYAKKLKNLRFKKKTKSKYTYTTKIRKKKGFLIKKLKYKVNRCSSYN